MTQILPQILTLGIILVCSLLPAVSFFAVACVLSSTMQENS